VVDTFRLFSRYYFDRKGYLGGTDEFHAMCASWLRGAGEILEIGAGPANTTSTFLATLGRTTGVDVSDEVRKNLSLSESHVYDGRALPFPHDAFDGCVSNYVVEHVEDVVAHFREVRRVLRPGGVYLFRTPNLLHYVALASRLLPHIGHLLVANRLRSLPAEAHDPWPTFYRANRPAVIRRLASRAGLEPIELRMVEKEPTYARASPWLYFPLMAYERLVNSSRLGAPFRANIFGVLQRPGRQAP
jgi:SAM-dependent methyltransferase